MPELVEALNSCLGGSAERSGSRSRYFPGDSTLSASPPIPRRKPRVAILAGLALAVSTLAALGFYVANRPENDDPQLAQVEPDLPIVEPEPPEPDPIPEEAAPEPPEADPEPPATKSEPLATKSEPPATKPEMPADEPEPAPEVAEAPIVPSPTSSKLPFDLGREIAKENANTPPSVAIDPFEGASAGEERIDNVLDMAFCWCPAGRFSMGSPFDEPERDDDEGPVSVSLSRGFWIGKFEVTQQQYEQLNGTNPSYFSVTGEGSDELRDVDPANFPVEQNLLARRGRVLPAAHSARARRRSAPRRLGIPTPHRSAMGIRLPGGLDVGHCLRPVLDQLAGEL